jgi:hypothetical protein
MIENKYPVDIFHHRDARLQSGWQLKSALDFLRQGFITMPFSAQMYTGFVANAKSVARLAQGTQNMIVTNDVATVGLTEAWRSRKDGAVFPLVPGAAGGEFDPVSHEFVNFPVSEVVADCHEFLEKLWSVNPKAGVILTVSPVPLIATYESRNVLVSNTYSKSVLRVAAEEVSRSYERVDYFPSYEIITGHFNRGAYYADDLREVRQEGVDHVMNIFARHYLREEQSGMPSALDDEIAAAAVVCDEEKIISL